MSISKNITDLLETLPEEVTLVAVSKTKPIEEIMLAYKAGQRIFGENKIQEMASKWEAMPKDIEWHMIGHVQTNKVKYMAPFVSLIHAVDRLKLLSEINKQAKKHDRVIECLVQIKIAQEDSKFGMSEKAAHDLLASEVLKDLKNIKIVGLMGMATFTENTNQIQGEFQKLKQLFDAWKEAHHFEVLSMGMSADYPLAITNGSNMVRVGSAIFGARSYPT